MGITDWLSWGQMSSLAHAENSGQELWLFLLQMCGDGASQFHQHRGIYKNKPQAHSLCLSLFKGFYLLVFGTNRHRVGAMRRQDTVPTESWGGGGVLWTIKIAFLFEGGNTWKATKQKKQKVPPWQRQQCCGQEVHSWSLGLTHARRHTHTHKLKFHKKQNSSIAY